ncbi:MAG: hypothetical protein JRE64_03895, partial [Deltaproteobacteria bacterium]|nr:hypothetical protein [Deltaproteobacteria bacterium]
MNNTGNGTATLSGTPGNAEVQVGSYAIELIVTDNAAPPFLSDTQNFTITVGNVNDEPIITGQDPDPLNKIIEDPDNTYPGDFTVIVLAGEHYSFSGSTITPDTDFNDTLIVPLMVRDTAFGYSGVYNANISINPVNDKPVIVAQAVLLATDEETPLTIELAHLTVTDPDNTYPTDFSLTVLPGDGYTVNGTAITPNTDV